LARGQVKVAGERLAASPAGSDVQTSERHKGERAFVEARYHAALGDESAVAAAVERAEAAFLRDGAGATAKLDELRAFMSER